jgi:NADPH:quinone reductase-like Zn-dependent oxidoreductase
MSAGARVNLNDPRVVNRQLQAAGGTRSKLMTPTWGASSLPLTDITAWEALFERLKIRPESDAGKGLLIIVGAGSMAIQLVKNKNAGFVWEFMFTRTMYQTPDMIQQHKLLCAIADMVDEEKIRTTLHTALGTLTPDNLREAHRRLKTGHGVGKLVLTGMV